LKIDDLITLISEKESKMLRNYSRTENHYDIAPENTKGSPAEDTTARPTIIFDILDEELIIKWIYLNKQNQGIGSAIVKWFIDYCEYKGLKKISIRSVGKDKNEMRVLAEKFGFKVINENLDSFDYRLVMREQL
jgi:hypothetical protein